MRAGVRSQAEAAFLDALGKLKGELGRLWKKRARVARLEAKGEELGEGEPFTADDEVRMWWCVERIISHTKAVIPLAVQHSGKIELPEVPVGLPAGVIAALLAQVEAAGGLPVLLEGKEAPQLPAPQDEGEDAPE